MDAAGSDAGAPADASELKAVAEMFESGELTLATDPRCAALDVFHWSNLLTRWLRQLAEPLFDMDKVRAAAAEQSRRETMRKLTQAGAGPRTGVTEAEARDLFAIFDKDGDDQIGLEDLRHVSEMLGRPLGDAEVAEIVRRYEHKKLSEDSLNFAEFFRWLRDEDNRRDA